MTILIKNGRVINPATNLDEIKDVLIIGEKVEKIANNIDENGVDKVIDATDCLVMPGFIDMNSNLRDPGPEEDGTIMTEMAAAAHGGYTTVLAMPNTHPVVDNPDAVNYVHNKAKAGNCINVLQVGSLTKGEKGEELCDFEGMKKVGVKALCEAGKSIRDTNIFYNALKKAKDLDLVVLDHCQDTYLDKDGVMNDDENAKNMDMPVLSNTVEDVIIARDLMLAHKANAKLHLCHCSTHGSVKMLEIAKEIGIDVTAEVTPHHFTLTSDDIKEFIPIPENGIMIPHDTDADTAFKVNPPLRTQKDKEELIKALKEGTIDVIATNHEPRTFDEKNTSMRYAPFGIVGFETTAAITYTELVLKDVLTPMQMAEKLSYNPAKIIGIDKGDISEGKTADVVIFDTSHQYKIDKNTFLSKGKNTPFQGREVTGSVRATICGGKVVFE